MNSILSSKVIGIIIVVIVIIIFITVSIINYKIKKPESLKGEECNTCGFKNSCPIIIKENEKNTE